MRDNGYGVIPSMMDRISKRHKPKPADYHGSSQHAFDCGALATILWVSRETGKPLVAYSQRTVECLERLAYDGRTWAEVQGEKNSCSTQSQ